MTGERHRGGGQHEGEDGSDRDSRSRAHIDTSP
jgi:hypothetical protein